MKMLEADNGCERHEKDQPRELTGPPG